eukprot:scaffold221_cov120-Cylindrotheca_fusiformis.AAC.1
MSETSISERLENLTISGNSTPKNLLICDAGYGFPRERKPRQEKINAIARQIVNFLQWQISRLKEDPDIEVAQMQLVGCPDEATNRVLEERIKSLLKVEELPSHVDISCNSLEDFCNSRNEKPIYLSPDAEDSMNPSERPPAAVVVGMLIDRRVQPNRSKQRASDLEIGTQRWSLDDCFAEIDPNEPLNVDCVLEGGGIARKKSQKDRSFERHLKLSNTMQKGILPGLFTFRCKPNQSIEKQFFSIDSVYCICSSLLEQAKGHVYGFFS